jgi:2-dehydropantoate 2-reductase
VKIAVVGCGAVGSYYGAMLARAGHKVHFLLRSDFEIVRRRGVCIRSRQGDFTVRPKPARSPEEIGLSDLVLIGLKTTANDQYGRLLPPLVGDRTALMTLQNGLGNEEQLARLFPSEQIMGGLCFVCLNRIEPGVVHHIDHGTVIVGEYRRWPEPRTHEIASTFRQAGVPCHVTDNLARAHWEKLIWNVPFNGLGVAGVAGCEAILHAGYLAADASQEAATMSQCLPTDKLLSDARWAGLVRELMLEVISVAQALGFPVAVSLADKNIDRTRTMGAYKASTLIDFERRQPLELGSLFLEPLRQAKKAGVPVPRLESLCRVLQQLNPANTVPQAT